MGWYVSCACVICVAAQQCRGIPQRVTCVSDASTPPDTYWATNFPNNVGTSEDCAVVCCRCGLCWCWVASFKSHGRVCGRWCSGIWLRMVTVGVTYVRVGARLFCCVGDA